MSPEQCRAARAWLNWSQERLAKAANVGLSTVRDFEKGDRVPIANNLAALKQAVEKMGIILTGEDDGALGIAAKPRGEMPRAVTSESTATGRRRKPRATRMRP